MPPHRRPLLSPRPEGAVDVSRERSEGDSRDPNTVTTPGAPQIFRILLPARDLAASRTFYERLLGIPGRVVAPGRVYFDAGPVILGILDRSDPSDGPIAGPTEAVYLATSEIETVHRRAEALRCLSAELLHGDPASPMGAIVERPWGERSFYVDDPSGNALCFVEEGTRFTGTPEQVDRLARG